MSSIHYAYSEELLEVITPFQAYEHFWKGHITDKRKFQCPGNYCKAQITCACLDIPETNWKQVPHFRVMDEHSEDCEYVKFINEESANYLQKEGLYTKKGDIKEIFLLSRKKNIRKRMVPNSPVSTTKNRYVKCPSGYSKYTPTPKYYSISPIVDNYFLYRENDEIEDKEIKIGKESILYKDLFKGIYHKLKIENYIGKKRIFWGKAYLNRLRNNKGYRIRFIEELTGSTDKKINPSIMFMDETFEKYDYKNRLNNYLVEENINTILLVFVYGEITETTSNAGNDYINIEMKNLDFIDFKSTDYLNKLTESKYF